MTMLRLGRREIGLMTLTALVCFAIAVPLTGSAAHQSQATVTIPPGVSVKFAGMGWTCRLTEADPAARIHHDRQNIGCFHLDPHKGIVGVWTMVDHSRVYVLRCTYGVRDCPRLGNWLRIP